MAFPDFPVKCAPLGPIAQLGERRVRNAEVEGSIPFRSTKILKRPASRWPFCFPAATHLAAFAGRWGFWYKTQPNFCLPPVTVPGRRLS